ncbi:MAG: ABC transporter ATP-binding protein [Anaerolineaceae bacterium]|nr:ABC transporter ATP-binding protein [Anaerolineaceae bacterium]
MAANPVIQTDNLTKVYKSGRESVLALKNLNLSVQPGEIFGFLGPNGAGKTTTIRVLLDLIRPTKGHASIFGQDANLNSVALHHRIGFLPGELNLWKNLTGKQVVHYVASVRGDDGSMVKHAHELAEQLSLDFSKKVRAYSSGNRRKLGLVVSMMHKPDLLILDEPTGGLDPLLQQTFNHMMLEARAAGRTVFLSSHVLGEVQAICDRVGILRNGELKAVERVDNLTHTNFHWVTLNFREAVAPEVVEQVPGVSEVVREDHSLRVRLSGDFDPLLRAVEKHYIVSVQTKEPTLEEIFLAFYGNNSSGEQTS